MWIVRPRQAKPAKGPLNRLVQRLTNISGHAELPGVFWPKLRGTCSEKVLIAEREEKRKKKYVLHVQVVIRPSSTRDADEPSDFDGGSRFQRCCRLL